MNIELIKFLLEYLRLIKSKDRFNKIILLNVEIIDIPSSIK